MAMRPLRQLLSKVRTLFGSFGFSSPEWKRRLAIRGRLTLSPSDFQPTDRLLRGCSLADLDDHGDRDVASFESRDLSCHWNRFSIASDIRHRPGGRATDGCYSMSVDTARFRNLATPRHDPIATPEYENYAHVEIRWLNSWESIDVAPSKGRAPSKCKTPRMAHQCRAKSEVRDSARHVKIVKSRFFATAVGAIRRAVAKNSCRN
jgi:hypothetical protein